MRDDNLEGWRERDRKIEGRWGGRMEVERWRDRRMAGWRDRGRDEEIEGWQGGGREGERWRDRVMAGWNDRRIKG